MPRARQHLARQRAQSVGGGYLAQGHSSLLQLQRPHRRRRRSPLHLSLKSLLPIWKGELHSNPSLQGMTCECYRPFEVSFDEALPSAGAHLPKSSSSGYHVGAPDAGEGG